MTSIVASRYDTGMEVARANAYPLTSFVGRRREIREVRALVKRVRLATLTGPGGAGKTRLALEAVAGVGEHFQQGIVAVELASLTEARLVQRALASALQVREQPGRPLLATIADYLRPRTTLVVLDNCEHLLAEVASLVDALLSGCPELHILATSRTRLGIDGEHVWTVPELAEAEAP